MEIIWSDIALHQLNEVLDYGYIHCKQSTATVVKMIKRWVEHKIEL